MFWTSKDNHLDNLQEFGPICNAHTTLVESFFIIIVDYNVFFNWLTCLGDYVIILISGKQCKMCSNNFGKCLGNYMCWAITCFGVPKLALICLSLGYKLSSKVSKPKILKAKKHLWVIPLRMSHLHFIDEYIYHMGENTLHWPKMDVTLTIFKCILDC